MQNINVRVTFLPRLKPAGLFIFGLFPSVMSSAPNGDSVDPKTKQNFSPTTGGKSRLSILSDLLSFDF